MRWGPRCPGGSGRRWRVLRERESWISCLPPGAVFGERLLRILLTASGATWVWTKERMHGLRVDHNVLTRETLKPAQSFSNNPSEFLGTAEAVRSGESVEDRT